MRRLRCAFCGLPAHGTRRGVLRCAKRTFRLAHALQAEDSQPPEREPVTYRYHEPFPPRGDTVNLSDGSARA